MINTESISQYHRDGYTIFRDVVDPELVAEGSAHVDWLLAKHPDRRGEELHSDLVPHDPFWLRLVSDYRLLKLAEMFVGPDIALYRSHYICKPPRSGRAVLWHQDGAYWNLSPMEVITFWLAIDYSTPENGCMRVIPQSHKGPLHALRNRDDVESVLGSEADTEIDEGRAVNLILNPGDVEVHHPNIMHASGENRSEFRRCGLTIRYIPTSTRIITDSPPWPSAFLLKGRPGVNVYQWYPRFEAGRDFVFRGAEQWNGKVEKWNRWIRSHEPVKDIYE